MTTVHWWAAPLEVESWRQAVLLIAGGKLGDDRFYDAFVPKAERIWENYIAATGQKKRGKS